MNIAIIGGGIAGLTTAIALKKLGLNARIFEAAPELKPVGAGLALAANAIQGFQRLGIDAAVMQEGRLLNGFTINDHLGRPITQTDTIALSRKYGADNFTIHRANLHKVLQSFLDPEDLETNKRCTGFEKVGEKLNLKFADGSTYQSDFLIAADGIHSPVRQQLLPQVKVRYAGYTCWRAVIDYPSATLTEAMETWGANGRFGYSPLLNNKLYWFACVNAPENDSRFKQFTVADLLRQFENYHHPIPEIISQTKNENLIWNDIIDLPPLSQYAFDNVLLIGDAAHATTPNMGQGACQAIEDAIVLADCIARFASIPEAFKAFEKRRLARTHFITRNSKRAGDVAQFQNPILIKLRNTFLRAVPDGIKNKQFSKVLAVDF